MDPTRQDEIRNLARVAKMSILPLDLLPEGESNKSEK